MAKDITKRLKQTIKMKTENIVININKCVCYILFVKYITIKNIYIVIGLLLVFEGT